MCARNLAHRRDESSAACGRPDYVTDRGHGGSRLTFKFGNHHRRRRTSAAVGKANGGESRRKATNDYRACRALKSSLTTIADRSLNIKGFNQPVQVPNIK